VGATIDQAIAADLLPLYDVAAQLADQSAFVIGVS
jgi:hypothetical protein